MLNLKTLETLKKKREHNFSNKARAYLAYVKSSYDKINKKYLKIEML